MKISAAYIKAISLFAADKNDARTFIHSVAINQGHIVATNGHVLGAIEIDSEFDVCIPFDAVSVLLKTLSEKDIREGVLIEVTENALAYKNVTVSFEPIKKFPLQWVDFITKHTEAIAHPYFDWKNIELFNKAAKILTNQKYLSTGFFTNGPDAARFEISLMPEFKGVIMPMHHDERQQKKQTKTAA